MCSEDCKNSVTQKRTATIALAILEKDRRRHRRLRKPKQSSAMTGRSTHAMNDLRRAIAKAVDNNGGRMTGYRLNQIRSTRDAARSSQME